ncbi:CBS domain-containing protein [Candidatus Woesearchaeota archaeon]|nr:CBS domain-containing protein [Candidatus Woesearchaeota archaeon]
MKRIFNSWRILTDIPVSKIMITTIKKLNENDTVDKAIKTMTKHSIGGLLILQNNGYPAGIVTEGDIMRLVIAKGKDPCKVIIKEIMSKNLMTIAPNISIGKASSIMDKHHIGKLPVVKKGKMVGYITKADILKATNQIYMQNRRLVLSLILNVVLTIIIVVLLAQVTK